MHNHGTSMKIINQPLTQATLLVLLLTVGVIISNLELTHRFFKCDAIEIVTQQQTDIAAIPLDNPVAPRQEINPACSCLNSKAPKECCIRFVHRLHKFGWVLGSKLFSNGDKGKKKHITMTTDFDHAYAVFPASAADYRQIFMARNVYKAIVSGYLYHKGGKECSDLRQERFGKSEWVKYTSHVTLPRWAMKNQTLCSYLAATTELKGLKLYIDVVFQKYYYNIIPFFHEVQRRKERYREDKTLVVCMDDLSHPDKKQVKYHEVMDWMFPSGQNFTIPRDIRVKKRYQGGHATSHNPELRARLISLIKKLDRDVFYDKVALVQDLLKCE